METIMISAEAERRRDAEKIENLLSEKVLDAAIEVHRTLGGPVTRIFILPRMKHSGFHLNLSL